MNESISPNWQWQYLRAVFAKGGRKDGRKSEEMNLGRPMTRDRISKEIQGQLVLRVCFFVEGLLTEFCRCD